MPYSIRKVSKKGCYSVKNKYTNRVFAKCATKENAKKQLRLLRAIEFNKSFKLLPKGKRPGDKRPNNKGKTKKRIS
jgi:hypothetical protein